MDRPDLAFIRNRIPIEDVARHLGLEVFRGHRGRCWRGEHHRNGDADPSLRFSRKNRCRCFVCDEHAFSNLDLIMLVLACDLSSAVEWITSRFAVPNVRPGRPIGARSEPKPYRVGATGFELEVVIRSGVWAELSSTARSILSVLMAFRDVDTGDTHLSYGALVRYAGVSRGNVAKALRELARLHAVAIVIGPRVDGLVRSVNTYHLTLDDPALQKHMSELYRSERLEVEHERDFRRQLRKARISKSSGKRTVDPPPGAIRYVDFGRGALPPGPPVFSLSLSTPKIEGNGSCTGLHLSSFSELKSNFLGQKKNHEIEPRKRNAETKQVAEAGTPSPAAEIRKLLHEETA